MQDNSDGKGPYIAKWNLEEPQPTDDELISAFGLYLDAEASKSIQPTDAERIAELEAENASLKSEMAVLNLQDTEIWETLITLLE